jgi:dihydrofolate reductase
VSSLKAGEGRNIQVMGSSQLARFLVGHDLVDEYRLMIEPILLGGGKRIFPDDGIARGLRLQSLTQASTGVLIVTYTRA